MAIGAPATNPASDLELKLPATIGTTNQYLKNSSTAGTLEFGSLTGTHGATDFTISDGNLVVAAGHGIDFSAQTATSATGSTTTSELLDHYEEGTWTATLMYWNSGWYDVTYDSTPSNLTGLYTRIGRLVHVQLYINQFDISTGVGSVAAIHGLPFADTTSDNNYGVVHFAHESCFTNGSGGGYIESSKIRGTDLGTTNSSTWKNSSTSYLMLSGTYEIN